MKASVRIRDVVIGEGIPKIIVPILGHTEPSLLEQAALIKGSPADAVEWRADWFEGLGEEAHLLQALRALRKAIGNLPLLFTIRTKSEGGQFEGPMEAYRKSNLFAAKSGRIDLIDVEFGAGEDTLIHHIRELQASNVKVVVSSHTFTHTPPQAEMLRRLCAMQQAGADIVKIAVMPNTPHDVIALLSASEEFTQNHAGTPVISISMGSLGTISRIAGIVSGTAMTFGTVGAASAPGQLPAKTLAELLQALHIPT